jgi:hypothetical protein
MATCKLCTEELGNDASFCRCGGQFHERCLENHDDWCPRAGEDRWIGAHER